MPNFPRTAEHAELDALFAHDLRSPIAAIAANFGFIKTAPGVVGDPMALEALRDVESATLVLQNLVDNMALLSALESGPSETAAEVVNLPESVLGCLDRMGPITASSEVRVESTIAPGAPGPRVFAVPTLLTAVVQNLYQTALRHTTRRECVRIAVLAEGTCGVLEIRDGGAPVPPALAEALFTRAGQRVAKRESSSRYGRGLGLLVAGLAARASGGSVQAVERDGRNAFRAAFKLAT